MFQFYSSFFILSVARYDDFNYFIFEKDVFSESETNGYYLFAGGGMGTNA